ncbi:capsule biosynthesis protein [Porphyrobacter sp. AAP60]|nr:capsule biosynthesis protein [Porphyrobacter sp. AAP60]
MVAALRRARVGGTFWLGDADLPDDRDVLLCASTPQGRQAVLAAAESEGLIGRAAMRGEGREDLPSFSAASDPWTLCARARCIIAHADDEWALVGALAGCDLIIVGKGRYHDLAQAGGLERAVQAEVLDGWSYVDPFTRQPASALATIEQLAAWRELIEANRRFAAIFGVAGWKRVTTDPLLWDGTGPIRHRSSLRPGELAAGDTVLAWIARTDEHAVGQLSDLGIAVGEIEDGMIRSSGLGANCVPPLSIAVDALGPHFDPSRPSELENILQNADIDTAMCARAARLRAEVVQRGIGKYGQDRNAAPVQPRESGRVVLVAGQVEDDRSVLCGGPWLDNFSLLQNARALEPDAWIIFKPHPDVEAGHRKGHVPDDKVLAFANAIDRTSSMPALLARVDAVHVITSLAGFEALLRGCEVVTHGVPFYAGWGLTRDLGPVPERRSRRRSLDEIVAATLILYPRYLDPVTRLPCSPEMLLSRIDKGEAHIRTPRILFRELLGRAKLLLGWR